jgi:hypothetical protein
MYELPPEIDLSFFVGCELEQVCIGEFQTQLRFDRSVSISIEREFTLDGQRQLASGGHVLHALLGKAVSEVRRVSPFDLAIRLEAHELVVHGVDNHYESYTIWHGNELIVV